MQRGQLQLEVSDTDSQLIVETGTQVETNAWSAMETWHLEVSDH